MGINSWGTRGNTLLHGPPVGTTGLLPFTRRLLCRIGKHFRGCQSSRQMGPTVSGEVMRKEDVDRAALKRLVSRIVPDSDSAVSIERTEDGVSTQVYRLRRYGEVLYLRIAEERAGSFAPEVRIHSLLRTKGVKVPEVVYFEPFDETLQRSVMVTTEIPGTSAGYSRAEVDVRAVLVEAGRDLALINGLPVEGFGWVKRDSVEAPCLRAEARTFRDWRLEGLDGYLELLGGIFLRQDEVNAIYHVIDTFDTWLETKDAKLAHGDFDATHIYQHRGQYSGIIDFGEIRGAEPLYDLAHFKLHDGETLPYKVLPHLLEGYGEVNPLPPDYELKIRLSALLIGVRALARSLSRPPAPHQRHLADSIRDDLRMLSSA